MADTTGCKASLLGLPREIRHMIYSYAVTEQQPIVSYIASRVRLPNKSESGAGRAVRETKHYPEVPGVASTCRQLRHEILMAFYAENTFLLTLKGSVKEGVRAWFGMDRPFSRLGQAIPMTQYVKHIVVECNVTPFPSPQQLRVGYVHGEVELCLNKESELQVQFGGEFDHQCVCQIMPNDDLPTKKSFDTGAIKTAYNHRLVSFAMHLERNSMPSLRLANFLSTHDPKFCEVCGKRSA